MQPSPPPVIMNFLSVNMLVTPPACALPKQKTKYIKNNSKSNKKIELTKIEPTVSG